jgi:nucleotide sugar dehydrogenase
MNIAIVGSGYVGLVTGACFADVGHHVISVDNDKRKIEALQNGRIPIYEPGLHEVIHRNVSSHRLRFTGNIRDAVENSEIIFIAVPTPPRPDGSVDLTYIEQVAREIAEVLTEYRVIVDKSTVPVKTGEKVADTIRRYNKRCRRRKGRRRHRRRQTSRSQFPERGARVWRIVLPKRRSSISSDQRTIGYSFPSPEGSGED